MFQKLGCKFDMTLKMFLMRKLRNQVLVVAVEVAVG